MEGLLEAGKRMYATQQIQAELIKAKEDEVAALADIVADLASTECTHEAVYYTWEQVVRRATGKIAEIIRDVSDHDEGWCWDRQLPETPSAQRGGGHD
jgi:hypothetical protein